MEMTKRVFKGIGGMILMLVAGIGTTNVFAQCEADIVLLQNPSSCSSAVILEANISDPVQSWNFLLDGTLVGNGSSVMLNLTPGTYTAGVVAITNQGCTAVDDTIFSVAGNPLEVNAGSDTVICQEQALLSVDVNSTNPYEVNWYPAQYLSNPESETPLITSNVTNQSFIVDVHDLVTGCVNSDTILVTQQNPVFDSLSLCDGAVQIDLGQGANMYDWLSWTDTSGTNHPLNYPTTQHVITVDEPGEYFAVAYFQECGALTSLVTVEACQSCESYFTYNSQPQQCGILYEFVAGGTTQIVSYNWDFGDGATSSNPQPTHFYTPGQTGMYTVTLTTEDVDGCVHTSTQQIAATIGHSVSVSNDTIACQDEAYMEAFAFGGSGNFSYEWFPPTGLSDPYSAVTHASGVHNQTYVVEVTDIATGCTVGEEITVSSYVAHFDTIYLCGDSVELDLGPGGDFYNWTPYYTADFETQSIWVDQTGDYFAYASFPGCGAITSIFPVVECPSTCTSSISNGGITYQNCGTYINLVGSYSSPIDSAIWDLGNGTILFDDGSGIPTQFYEGGNYIVQLTAYHAGGCVSTTSYGLTLLTDIEVDITVGSPIACNGGLPLSNDVSGGSGQYSYSWHPASAMDDPNAAIPWMTVTQNTFAIVEVVDQLTGCFAIDSIYVYANEQVNEIIELCADSFQLELDPGSLFYNWAYTDSLSNTTNLPNQTNEIWVDEEGTYHCFTYQSGCNQVAHTFEVIACGTNCSSEFITFENPQSCGLLVDFAGQNFSSPVDSVVWNYGDGQTYTDMGGGEAHFYGPGTYQATMIAYHSNGCISDFGESIFVNSGLTVELIEDTIACNGTLFLSYNLTGGSGNYTYDWWPASLMSDPNASNPQMTVQYDTWVDFTITDTQSGCIAVDSMYVYANEAVYDSLQLCSDSLQLGLSSGSMVYNWSFTDQFGNTSQLQNFGNEIWVDDPGTYICLTYYSGCNTITHTFIVEECSPQNDDVWPGDANSDNIVTNSDALYLGLAFNQTGPTRPAATLNWVGQPCPDWVFNFAQNNVNIKHADCDGNGIINFDDTLAIDFNYLNTHNKFEGVSAGGNPPLWVEAIPDTVGLEQAIDIVVHLGSVDQPIDSLHGVAFSLTFDESLLTESGFSIDFDNCALGTAGNDVLTFQKSFFNDGALDLAMTRNTLQNFQGYGPIVHARIVTTDNLSGVHELPIGASNAFALTASETEVALTAIPDTVTIDPNKVGIVDPVELEVTIYPNPTNGLINIVGVNTGNVVVLNSLGQAVHTEPILSSNQSIELGHLPNGVYMLHLRTDKAIAVERVRILR
jgi:hypothetical protein